MSVELDGSEANDQRNVDLPSYDPRLALTECLDLWASGAWPESNDTANLREVMLHVEKLIRS